MFRNSGITTIGNVYDWNTSNVTGMSNMFMNASNLTHLDLSGWNPQSVTDMSFMFSDTLSLITIGNLSSWNTTNVTNMERMFRNSGALTQLEVSGWDMAAVGNTHQMFTGMVSLRLLALGEGFRANVTGLTGLPNVPNNAVYTGRWRNVGNGTVSDPQGNYVLTSVELMTKYGAGNNALVDLWVWLRQD